jgi:hypothetical protein
LLKFEEKKSGSDYKRLGDWGGGAVYGGPGAHPRDSSDFCLQAWKILLRKRRSGGWGERERKGGREIETETER